MPLSVCVHNMNGKASLSHRLGLGLILFIQITIIPVIGFSLTHLIHFNEETYALTPQFELLHWIIVSGLTYGIVCLLLALVIGGYRPTAVVERGGWLPALGLSRRKYDPELIDRAKMASYSSPYGKMSRLVSDRIRSDKNELLAIHGGLQLIAVPSQVLLISIPIIIMEGIPENFIRKESAFELGIIGYILGLWIAFRIQPFIARQLIGFAARFRNILWKITKVSWILPIIILWSIARLTLDFSVDALGVQLTQWHNVQLEGVFLSWVSPNADVPKGSSIDSVVALSVLPMAAFTTISVLGGSNGIPDWMKSKEEELENLSQQSLPEPKEIVNEEEISEEILVQNDTIKSDLKQYEEERMIDIPDLFGW